MKTYTDLEQSKVLADILKPESADMWYSIYGNPTYNPTIAYKGQQWFLCQIRISLYMDIPAWSLAALLNVIPGGQVNRRANSNKWEASSWNDSDFEPAYYVEDYDNPVDACVAMVVKLHELKLL